MRERCQNKGEVPAVKITHRIPQINRDTVCQGGGDQEELPLTAGEGSKDAGELPEVNPRIPLVCSDPRPPRRNEATVKGTNQELDRSLKGVGTLRPSAKLINNPLLIRHAAALPPAQA